jgi:hypothetical protein
MEAQFGQQQLAENQVSSRGSRMTGHWICTAKVTFSKFAALFPRVFVHFASLAFSRQITYCQISI